MVFLGAKYAGNAFAAGAQAPHPAEGDYSTSQAL